MWMASVPMPLCPDDTHPVAALRFRESLSHHRTCARALPLLSQKPISISPRNSLPSTSRSCENGR
jgi:hypothetical protein